MIVGTAVLLVIAIITVTALLLWLHHKDDDSHEAEPETTTGDKLTDVSNGFHLMEIHATQTNRHIGVTFTSLLILVAILLSAKFINKNCRAGQLELNDGNKENKHRRRKEEDKYTDRRLDQSDEEDKYTERRSSHIHDLRRNSHQDRQHRQKGHKLGKGQFGQIQGNFKNLQKITNDTDKHTDSEKDEEPEPR